MSGVKNLLPSHSELLITRLVDSIMEGNDGAEEFLTLDPKSVRTLQDSKKPTKPSQKFTFQEAVVFVIGGGSYMEYQNLNEYCNVSGRGNLNP